MNIIKTVTGARALVDEVRAENNRIAFVPTMGHLHEGHLSLVRKARELADFVIVSIYLNSMQFGPNEDLDGYPRTFEDDIAKLTEEKVTAVFAPTESTMYPAGNEGHTRVSVDALDGMHCGISRPQFFTGIATVVAKLLNIIRPDIAVFGEKDFQQLCIIKKMVQDMMFAIEIVGVPTVRMKNGLALSSRNTYLSEQEQIQASQLYKLITGTMEQILSGQHNYSLLSREGLEAMASVGLKPDYFNIVSQGTLKAPAPDEKSLVILAACWLNNTRLIDNIKIQLM